MKKLLLLLTGFCFCQCSFAQKTLYLKPFAGIQWVLCAADKNVGNKNVFGASKGMATNNFGVLLEMPLNEKWSVVTGWSPGNIGWGYKLQMPNELTKNPGKIGSFEQRTRATQIHRFPVLVKRNLAEFGWGDISEGSRNKKFNFKVYAQTGVSLDLLPETKFVDETNASFAGRVADSYGDSVIYYQRTTVLNRWNMSVLAGLGTQFYFKNKPCFDITLYYSQGLRNMIQEDVAYQLNSYKNTGTVFTRGSVVGATLSIPIKLKTFPGKQA